MNTKKQAITYAIAELAAGLLIILCFLAFFWGITILGKIWDDRHEIMKPRTHARSCVSTRAQIEDISTGKAAINGGSNQSRP